MKYRPSLSFVVLMSLMGVSGIGGAWAWTKADRVPHYKRVKMGFWEALTYKEEKRIVLPELTPEERKQMEARVTAAIAELEKKFPILQIEERPVPDEVNGYRLIHELMDPHSPSPWLVDKELGGLLAGDAPWDAARVEAGLAEKAELVRKIEHIASLPTRSSTSMPESYTGFISARSGKLCAEILLAKARLAAEAGNEKEALRQVAAALNFARHYSEVEEPTLLGETVTILCERMVEDRVFTQLLPALGKSADLAAWQQVLAPRDLSPAHWTKLMRGEWHMANRFFLMPVLLDERREDNPPDVEEFLQVYAENWAGLMGYWQGLSLKELSGTGDPGMAKFSSLSDKSRELAKLFFIGTGAWTRGYIRHVKLNAQHQAALELMISEKAGEILTSASAEKVTRDPLDGTAFSYDPAKRTLISTAPGPGDKPTEIVLPF